MSRARSLAGPLVAVALVVAACGHGISAGGLGPADPAAATPLASVTTAIETSASVLKSALAAGGYELDPVTGPFRSSEPASLIGVPRAVYRVRLADPDDGAVVIYQLPDANAAGSAAAHLAGYLASGSAKVNYPADALVSVAQLGPTVILTWFSPGRSDDPDAARGAFELIAAVGRAYPVLP
jgi:hypothetical protein